MIHEGRDCGHMRQPTGHTESTHLDQALSAQNGQEILSAEEQARDMFQICMKHVLNICIKFRSLKHLGIYDMRKQRQRPEKTETGE